MLTQEGPITSYCRDLVSLPFNAMRCTAQVDLWKTSGHFEFYEENMFDQMKVEGEEYQLRPMNCPFHIAIYNVRCWPPCTSTTTVHP